MPRRIRSLGLFGKTARTPAKPNAQTQYAMDKYAALLPLVNGREEGDSRFPPLEGDPATLLHRLGPPLPFVLGGSPRLSVTRLMTKGWCELRYLYDARAGIPRPAAAAATLTRGTRAHARLEDSAHPADARVAAALRAEGMGDFVRTLPYGWAATLGRLLQLAAGGESREVLCHGWVRGSSDAPPVLVSGVVDRLSWEGGTPAQLPLDDSMDIARLLPLLQEQVRQRVEHGSRIVVSDTKTRSTFTTPTQGSVLRATTMQLAYYRGYLEALAQDAPRTFASLLENARLHGVDADAPLQTREIAALVRLVPSLQADAALLAAGEPVHTPVGRATVASPRWLAARLAQGYALLGGALGGSLRVEYYCRGTHFHTATVRYSTALRAKRVAHEADAAAFLWGRRPVQPVARRLDALRTYCARCDYAAVCGWKRGVERDLGGLGPALVRVASGARV